MFHPFYIPCVLAVAAALLQYESTGYWSSAGQGKGCWSLAQQVGVLGLPFKGVLCATKNASQLGS